MKHFRFFIFILGLTLMIPMSNVVFGDRQSPRNDGDLLLEKHEEAKEQDFIDPEDKIRTSFTIEHLDYKTGELLKVDDNIDGYVNENIEVNRDFINAFRGYEYRSIKFSHDNEDSDRVKIRLSENKDDNKVYLYYDYIGDGTVSKKNPSTFTIIDKLDKKKYLEGYSDRTIRPEENITREEVATVFFRLLNKDYRDKIITDAHSFKDVDIKRWSNTYIASLIRAEILEGYSDGSFRPDEDMTRGELMAVISRLENTGDETTKSEFIDIDRHWAKKYIDYGYARGLIRGYLDGSFRPDDKLTRAEFASIVNRLLAMEEPAITSSSYKDLDRNKWYYLDIVKAVD